MKSIHPWPCCDRIAHHSAERAQIFAAHTEKEDKRLHSPSSPPVVADHSCSSYSPLSRARRLIIPTFVGARLPLGYVRQPQGFGSRVVSFSAKGTLAWPHEPPRTLSCLVGWSATSRRRYLQVVSAGRSEECGRGEPQSDAGSLHHTPTPKCSVPLAAILAAPCAMRARSAGQQLLGGENCPRRRRRLRRRPACRTSPRRAWRWYRAHRQRFASAPRSRSSLMSTFGKQRFIPGM